MSKTVKSIFKDIKATMAGEDLPEKTTKTKSTTKSTKSSGKSDGYKSKVTDKAKSDAIFYVGNREALSNDFKDALDGKPLSSDLKKALQVLIDNDEFRAMIGCQDGVLPSMEDYSLAFDFLNKNGGICTAGAIGLIEDGATVAKLEEDYGIKLSVYRIRKINGERIKDADEKEVKETIRRIQAKHYNKKTKIASEEEKDASAS